MAEEKISFSVEVSTSEAIQRTGSLKAAIKEAERQAQELSLKGFNEEALTAAKNAARLKEELSDMRDRISALNPEAKFTAITQAAQGIAGGFAAAEGAMALFGSESKDVHKALLQVQGALALTEGLNAVRGLGDAFSNIKIIVVDAAAKMAAYMGVVEGATLAQNALNVSTRAFQLLTGPLGLAIAALGGAVAILTDYLGKEKEAHEESAKAAEEAAKKKVEAEKRYAEAAKTVMQTNKSLRDEYVGNLKKTRELEKQIEDERYAAVKKQLDDELYLSQGSTVAQENLRLALEVHRQKINEINAKYDAEEQALKDAHQKELDAINARTEETNEKAWQRSLERQIKQLEIEDQIAAERLRKQKEFNDKANADEEEARRWADQTAEEWRKKELEDQKRQNEAKWILANQGVAAMASLGQIFMDNEEQMSEFQKDLALVQIGIDTARAVSSAVASAKGLTGFDYAAQIGVAVGAVFSAVAQAKKILSSSGKVKAGSLNIPSTATGITAPQTQAQTGGTGSAQVATGVDSQGNLVSGYMRAYVVESDISGKQARIGKIERNSKF